ncbi:MAG: phosphotransacetylase family protein [Synechococcales cyanobacterium]
MSRVVIIGSTHAFSGKSAAILGLAKLLRHHHLNVMFGKPIGSCPPGHCPPNGLDEDLAFIAKTLNLSPETMPPMVARMDDATLRNHIHHPPTVAPVLPLQTYCQSYEGDLLLLEGPADLHEGFLMNLSLAQMAAGLDAQVLLVSRFTGTAVVDGLLVAQQQLGSRLMGVLFNDVPPDQIAVIQTEVTPFLAQRGIPTLGILPSHSTLRSISVEELVNQLQAEVLCCPDRLDEILIETFVIGAMSVNSALKYFRRSEHKAVITGGDRTDIQLAALETASACLILTGKHPLDPRIRQRAEELEVPILLVDLDTFTTSERIEQVFGHVRLHETVKVRCIESLMSANFDFAQFCQRLQLTPPLVGSRTAP